MSFKSSLPASQERGIVDMSLDLFSSLFAMGVRFTLVLGVMLFIVSLCRDGWNVFSKYE
jgi:hypothetical protein